MQKMFLNGMSEFFFNPDYTWFLFFFFYVVEHSVEFDLTRVISLFYAFDVGK